MEDVNYAERVSQHLLCSICTEVFDEPQHLPCAHVFCTTCITQWLATKKECPQCRRKIRMQQLHKDLTVRYIIDDLRVRCSFANAEHPSRGCQWVGKRKNLAQHVRQCEMDPAKVPDWLADNGDISFEKLSVRQKKLRENISSFKEKKSASASSKSAKDSDSEYDGGGDGGSDSDSDSDSDYGMGDEDGGNSQASSSSSSRRATRSKRKAESSAKAPLPLRLRLYGNDEHRPALSQFMER